MARRNRGRPVNGILLLDKAPGGSSNAVLQAAKRLFDARKAGHTGSLDPLASGLLPLCFGEATKVSGFLLDADKTYWLRARFGIKTASGDAEGDMVAESDAPLPDPATLQAALAGFLGEQQQIPPMYSAVKHQGKRLYELARAGVEVERKPRPIRIDTIDLLGHAVGETGREVELQVRCSKGTYVRTLVEDVAEQLGHFAHVSALRRTALGPFDGAGMVTMEQLQETAEAGGASALDARLLPIGAALAHWPAVALDAASQFYLSRGQAVQIPQAPTSGWVRMLGANQEFVAVGEVLEDGRIAPRRMFKPRGA